MTEGQDQLADRLFATIQRFAPDMPEATAWKLTATIIHTLLVDDAGLPPNITTEEHERWLSRQAFRRATEPERFAPDPQRPKPGEPGWSTATDAPDGAEG